jgi:hypothetical protein
MTDSHILKSLAALPLEHISFISYSRTMCGSFQWFVRTPGGDACNHELDHSGQKRRLGQLALSAVCNIDVRAVAKTQTAADLCAVGRCFLLSLPSR